MESVVAILGEVIVSFLNVKITIARRDDFTLEDPINKRAKDMAPGLT